MVRRVDVVRDPCEELDLAFLEADLPQEGNHLVMGDSAPVVGKAGKDSVNFILIEPLAVINNGVRDVVCILCTERWIALLAESCVALLAESLLLVS